MTGQTAVDINVHSALDPTSVTTVHAEVVIRTAPPVIVGGVSVETSMGATVQVPLDARDAENLYGAGCRVTYDDKALQFVSIAKGGLLGTETLFIENHGTAGEVRIASTLEGDAQPVSGNGTIAVLTFRALGAGMTQLDIDELELLGGTIAWDAASQTVTISLDGTELKLVIGKSNALVNGRSTPIDSTNPKVVPQILNSRTMLPLRFVAESLGADVQWEASTQTITITYPKP